MEPSSIYVGVNPIDVTKLIKYVSRDVNEPEFPTTTRTWSPEAVTFTNKLGERMREKRTNKYTKVDPPMSLGGNGGP